MNSNRSRCVAVTLGTAAGGVLAVGLGIGATLATAGTASADPVSAPDPNVVASVDGVTGILGSAAVDPFSLPDPNVAISFDGMTLLQEGSATATSGTGDLAIALGANSDALADNNIFDSAFALGTGSDAVAQGSVLLPFTGGPFNTAFAVGTNSFAEAGKLGSFDTAIALGTNSSAEAVRGHGNLATAIDTGSAPDMANAGGSTAGVGGSEDIAFVLGTGSDATAGADATTAGNFDLAAAFGDMLNAIATGGNFLTDVLPSL
jgi:hypothetical protein